MWCVHVLPWKSGILGLEVQVGRFIIQGHNIIAVIAARTIPGAFSAILCDGHKQPNVEPGHHRNGDDPALAGREGFEPSVELFTPQPLSRRPQSSTLAPPQKESIHLGCGSGGRGIRTPGDLTASAVFKTAAIVHSAIPPRRTVLIRTGYARPADRL